MAQQDWIYRPGKLVEKPALQQLARLAFDQFRTLLPEEEWNRMDRFLHNDRMWDHLLSTAFIFICESHHTIVGSAYLIPSGNPTTIYPADWSYIRMVSVDPRYRGRGIARTLMQDCIGQARQLGEKFVGLHTSEKMPDAQHVYETLGFRRIRELDPIYGMKYWLYLLELDYS